MFRFLRAGDEFRDDPLDMLWHYARGYFPFEPEGLGQVLRWVKFSHRGLQPLDAIHIGQKQKRDVFARKFELRFDTQFETVVRKCAGQDRDGNWMNETSTRGYCRLYEMGFAHSYECWEGGRLVGGCFGVHIGSYVSIESMFHEVDNASKAAYVRALLHLRERGFQWMDVNFVTHHLARWGAKWVPQWRFEQMLRQMIGDIRQAVDGKAAPRLPVGIRLALPLARAAGALRRRVAGRPAVEAAPEAAQGPAGPESSTPEGEQREAQGIGLAGTGQ